MVSRADRKPTVNRIVIEPQGQLALARTQAASGQALAWRGTWETAA